MPRKLTGNVHESRGRWYARITLAKGQRSSFPLATCSTAQHAEARLAVLVDFAVRLRAAGVPAESIRTFLETAGAAADGKPLDRVRNTIEAVCKGDARSVTHPSKPMTFRQVGEQWTSGALARLYPDQVKAKGTAGADAQRLDTYVYPIVGPIPIADFTLDDAERVMRSLSTAKRIKTPATRRHVGQLIHRILGLSVFPLRLRTSNPLPKGFLPKVGPSKAKSYLYPKEEARLMASVDVPLGFRVFYGFLAREGPRAGEAEAFEWRDFDFEHGVVKLDENKTDDPRAWALDQGVLRGIKAWRVLREAAGVPVGPHDRVFALRDDGHLYDPAKLFRAHLRAAGVDRPELFDRTASRLRIRRHDLRATFVTLNLAAGRTETWIADRTGHKSSDMINRYRRVARTAAELGLGELAALDQAIPELAVVQGHDAGSTSGNQKARQGGPDAPNRAAAVADDAPAFSTVGNEGDLHAAVVATGSQEAPEIEKAPEKDPFGPPRSKTLVPVHGFEP